MADKAVLCGINDYKAISDLRGCINDIHNIRRLLTEKLEFNSHNIRTYEDADVTKKTVTSAFQWLADGAADGDRLLFHFSGHGSYTQSRNADEEFDELICLHDMNWSEADTYLLDEDLGSLTQLVTKGRLTVILDCCHSGSGTRAITKNFAPARSASPNTQLMIVSDTAAQMELGSREDNVRRLESGNTALMRSFRNNENHPVFARFVEPPAKFRMKTAAPTFKRLGATMRATLNHQLLAGARDDQTAADAFIDGEYNGAFSYYLCKTVREQGIRSYNATMEDTVDTIDAQGYSQIPQNEGPFGDELVLGGDDSSWQPPMPPVEAAELASSVNVGMKIDAAPASLPGEREPLELLGDLLRVSEKLIDLAEPARAVRKIDVRSRGDEVVVYVHGISRHVRGYSARWFQALRPHLSRDLQRGEVLWSPHVNPRTAVARDAASEDQARQLAQQIEQELAQRANRLKQQHLPESGGQRMARPRGSGFAVDDFTRYMLNGTTRRAILGEFDAVVRPLLADGKTLHIISHSWGTVVSYEGLRNMDSAQFPGRVANLFYAGSALSIGLVRSNLFGRVTDGRKPGHVDRIINVDAGGDVVGGGIGAHFAVDREFLGVAPVGCSTIILTDIALNPSCAHSSYFDVRNTQVNRDIFARFLNNS